MGYSADMVLEVSQCEVDNIPSFKTTMEQFVAYLQ